LGQALHLSAAKRRERLPTVLTRDEVLYLIAQLSVTYQLMARILYSSGLRLMECARLRGGLAVRSPFDGSCEQQSAIRNRKSEII